MSSGNLKNSVLSVLTTIMLIAFAANAHSQEAVELMVDAWRTDAQGTIRISTDGETWSHIPAPTHLPMRAVYRGAVGLWAIKLDDGRIVYVRSLAFLKSTSITVPCEGGDDAHPKGGLETRGFGECPP